MDDDDDEKEEDRASTTHITESENSGPMIPVPFLRVDWGREGKGKRKEERAERDR